MMIVANLLLLGFIFFVPSVPASAAVRFDPDTIFAEGHEQVCPGDVLEFEVHLEVKTPAVVEVSESIIDVETGDDVDDHLRVFPPRPKPFENMTIVDRMFEVPELPSGDYVHVVGVTSQNLGASPAFLMLPFSIGDDCGTE
jgi:hypothetical protein